MRIAAERTSADLFRGGQPFFDYALTKRLYAVRSERKETRRFVSRFDCRR